MSDEKIIEELTSRIECLANEGTTLEGYVATSQAIAQMVLARQALIEASEV